VKSNTTVIGRLVSKVSVIPPRWLVAFDEFEDEEIAEETIGRVMDRMDESPVATNDSGGTEAFDDPSAGTEAASPDGAINAEATASGKADITTRSTKKRTSSQSGINSTKTSPGATISSGDSSPAEDSVTVKATVSTAKTKKKGVTFSSRSRSNSEVSAVPSTSKDDNAPLTAAAAATTTTTATATTATSTSALEMARRVSDREQRSRRRQALGHEEGFQVIDTSNSSTKIETIKRPLVGTNLKHSNFGPKNKKA
jgi:hypothetical protein